MCEQLAGPELSRISLPLNRGCLLDDPGAEVGVVGQRRAMYINCHTSNPTSPALTFWKPPREEDRTEADQGVRGAPQAHQDRLGVQHPKCDLRRNRYPTLSLQPLRKGKTARQPRRRVENPRQVGNSARLDLLRRR